MNPPTSTKRPPWAKSSPRSELKADHQVQRGQWHGEREVAPADDAEVRGALFEDLARDVEVLARDEPVVAHPVAALEDPLSAHAPRERVSKAALARDHRDETAARLEHAPDLRERGRQVRQVLEHVDREH